MRIVFLALVACLPSMVAAHAIPAAAEIDDKVRSVMARTGA